MTPIPKCGYPPLILSFASSRPEQNQQQQPESLLSIESIDDRDYKISNPKQYLKTKEEKSGVKKFLRNIQCCDILFANRFRFRVFPSSLFKYMIIVRRSRL